MQAEQALAQAALDSFGERLDALDTAMRPVLEAMDEVRAGGGEELPPLMRARVDATLAYALNAIFCMYLRTQGQDPTEHPVREEIARVRAAYVRIHEIDVGKRQRPRKRLQAAVFVAEQELTRVLSDGERALHHAVNGKTEPERDVGVKKVFKDSSEDSGNDESPDVDSTEKPKRSPAKSAKRKRNEASAISDARESSTESGAEEDAKADLRAAKEEKRRRKQEKRDKKEKKKEKKEKKSERKRRKSAADVQ